MKTGNVHCVEKGQNGEPAVEESRVGGELGPVTANGVSAPPFRTSYRKYGSIERTLTVATRVVGITSKTTGVWPSKATCIMTI